MKINSIEEYLKKLSAELKGSDPATIQDALSDAEDHLFSALETAREGNSELQVEEALGPIIEAYGTPAETASAYREIESRMFPTLSSPNRKSRNSSPFRFFEIFADPKAWGALLYMLISLLTGIVYFTWAVTGLSFSLALAIFIFGLPLVAFFVLSVRGIALLEGRIVEALLGVRMPRRPLFNNPELPWRESLKASLLDKHNWSMLLYLILQLPLGIVYFTFVVFSLSFSLSFMAAPFIQSMSQIPLITIFDTKYIIPDIWLPLVIIFGFVLLTATMHFAKWVGKLHASYAKKMLISD